MFIAFLSRRGGGGEGWGLKLSAEEGEQENTSLIYSVEKAAGQCHQS